jgi:hypothetical protein
MHHTSTNRICLGRFNIISSSNANKYFNITFSIVTCLIVAGCIENDKNHVQYHTKCQTDMSGIYLINWNCGFICLMIRESEDDQQWWKYI